MLIIVVQFNFEFIYLAN